MRDHVSGLLLQVLAGLAVLAACRPEPDWGDGAVDPMENPRTENATGGSRANGAGASGGNASGAAAAANGGTGSAARGGAAASAGGAGEAEGAAGGGDTEPNPDVACDGQDVSWEEIQSGQVRVGAGITLDAIVTSQKFLVSHSKAGSCLWGVFVGAEPVAGKPRGILLVSYGERAEGEERCPSGTDGLPDVLAPGDRLSAVGTYSPYAQTSCAGVVPAPQLRVEAACPVVVSGKGAPVMPVTVSHADADVIAQGTDAAVLRQYAAGLVRLEDVSGVRAEDGEGVVAPYGVLRFAETRLEVHNDVEYGAVTAGGRSLAFPYPSRFATVTGLVHLDYCSWTLAPRDRCRDFQPPSANCPR
jgi:hypothetical protein